jgi:hypothetical protein
VSRRVGRGQNGKDEHGGRREEHEPNCRPRDAATKACQRIHWAPNGLGGTRVSAPGRFCAFKLSRNVSTMFRRFPASRQAAHRTELEAADDPVGDVADVDGLGADAGVGEHERQLRHGAERLLDELVELRRPQDRPRHAAGLGLCLCPEQFLGPHLGPEVTPRHAVRTDDREVDEVANSGSPRRVEQVPRPVDLDAYGVAALIRSGGEMHDRVDSAYRGGNPIARGQVGTYPLDGTAGSRGPAAGRPDREAGLGEPGQQCFSESPGAAGHEHGSGSVAGHEGVDAWAGEFVTSR